MNTKRAIKRMLLTLMWLGVAVGMFTIIAAAMRVQDDSVCAGYGIHIQGAQEGSLFTSKDQIIKLLKAATHGEIKGQRKADFNLPQIEDLLEQSSWVYSSALYFDNKDILHVNVTERKPLARVFAQDGGSFYIDEAGKQIPLSDKISLDVPVFTGYPNKKIMNATDSSLLENMIAAASFINSDSFWVSQVSQIDIHKCGSDCWNMEMIPVVGNHHVDLGDGSDIASKFHRLYLFYDQVLKRTGFDKYQKIDVQYNGQVIGVKGNYTKVDSLQLRKNIDDLLQQSRKTNDMIEETHAMPGTRLVDTDTTIDAARMFTEPLVEPQISDTIAKEETAENEVVNKKEVSKGENADKKPVKKAESNTAKKEIAKKSIPVKKEEKKTVIKAPVKKPADKKVVKKTVETKPGTTAKPAAKTKESDRKKTTAKKTSN